MLKKLVETLYASHDTSDDVSNLKISQVYPNLDPFFSLAVNILGENIFLMDFVRKDAKSL